MPRAIAYAFAGLFVGPLIWFFKLRIYETGLGGDNLPLLVLSIITGAVVLGFAGYFRDRQSRAASRR
jgi:hypothetical protein